MELKQFIKKAITDIVESVDEVSEVAARAVQLDSSKETRSIEFDIAVTVEKGSKAQGTAGIRVLEFAQGGGELSQETRNSTVSRVKFGVNVSQLTKEKAKEISARLKNKQPMSFDYS